MGKDKKTPKKQPLPGHETQSEEMVCQKCGRFVGAATKCPYCGAKVEKRMSLVAIRWAAVLLATVGLVLLYFMARNHEVPRVQIGDIEPTMNFGAVRLVGEVTTEPKSFKNGNGMSFYVSDGTGKIIVFVNESQRDTMAANGIMPQKGDEIDFVVQLQTTATNSTSRIHGLDPDSFQLTRDGAPVVPGTPAPAKDLGDATPFSAIDASLDGKSVVLEGTVESVKAPEPGTKQPYVMTLSDGAATQSVKIWTDQYVQIPDAASLVGKAVRAKVNVKLYQDNLDLVLKKGADLQRADAAPAPAAKPAAKPAAPEAKAAPEAPAPAPAKRSFDRGRSASVLAPGDVTADLDGQTVTVSGTVAAVYPPKAADKNQPWSLTLADPATGARLSVKYWDDARAAFPREPAPGDVFEFGGKVNVYNGKASLVVSSGAKAKFSGAGEPPPPARKKAVSRKAAIPVAEVTADKAGTYVTIEGALSEPSDRAGKGTACTLTDDTGSIMVVFWNTSIPADAQAKAAAAARVRVNGKVKDYQGTLQVTPGANGLTILE